MELSSTQILVLLAIVYGVSKIFEYLVRPKIPNAEMGFAQKLVLMAVEAVEQQSFLLGGDKKTNAFAKARQLLMQYGLKVADEALDALIEQAVLRMNINMGKEPKKPM